MEVLAFISFFFGASWDFFTEIKVPGFEFSFAALFIGIFLANLGLRFLFSMLGVGIHSDDVTSVIGHGRGSPGIKNDPDYHETTLWR